MLNKLRSTCNDGSAALRLASAQVLWGDFVKMLIPEILENNFNGMNILQS